ncbi:hypothetical protein C7N43_31780 [Sphingobacteriales bacterium UPWRP_1]|nr:hypothetical protein BVG80_09235 [Sphingobacteriales bacterium TSM_CSM]PSJ72917.1 hypothetical protein C7N43_31780 [Sphingobacteriales bacterium UPWRP_1]
MTFIACNFFTCRSGCRPPKSGAFFVLLLLAAGLLLPAQAQVKLVGAARKLDENRYRLTRELPSTAGAVWAESTIDLNDAFEINFDVFLGCGNNNADGVAFVLQQKGTKTVGQIGSGIGYKGISPSLVIEFDNYLNEFESFFPSAETHVAIVKNGDNDHLTGNTLAGPVVMSPQKAGSKRQCKYHKVKVSWEPASQTIEVYVDEVLTLSWAGDLVNSVFNGKPDVYWGFTAATSKTRINAQGVLLKFKPLTVNLAATSPKCAGSGKEGTITAKVKGGIGKYTYKWSNGATAKNLNNLPAGSYTLTVTDNWGNKATESVVVKEPAPLQITDVVKIGANELYNWKGSATGGTPPYNFRKGYAILSGSVVNTITETGFQNHSSQAKKIYENESAETVQAAINSASAQNPVAVTGFITATDANGCSITQYLPFTFRKYPLPQPPEPVASIAALKIDTDSLLQQPPTPDAPPAVPDIAANAATTQPPATSTDLDNVKLVYTERNVPATLNNRAVKTGKRIVINSETVNLSVWDDEYDDGDTISIYYNGEWLLREYRLKTKPYHITIQVDRNADNYLILYAHNEGKRPPNTAAVTIDDGKNTRRVALSSGLNYCDALNFKFKKE